jgi:hypothetical protein
MISVTEVQKNTKTLLDAVKEIDLEVNLSTVKPVFNGIPRDHKYFPL